ncbi:hypothetical protein J2W21_003394 [Sinomonas atrocyanea]|uniref:hypothetical protein n=1 Tax=Sinomonas atrocyanea TaxID=37927 RepID=UPI00278326D3|nr:hypothetical protein [Sinomonas atrocyanea]MDP9885869.1 hypothetical protein [Sinomonas atrocyanea]
MAGFALVACCSSAAAYLGLAAVPFRRARQLASRGPGWREVTAVVVMSSEDRTGTTWLLEADDVMGKPRYFTIRHFGRELWEPMPERGQKVVFALVANGSSYALFSTGEDPRLRLVRVQVPSSFELRAMQS